MAEQQDANFSALLRFYNQKAQKNEINQVERVSEQDQDTTFYEEMENEYVEQGFNLYHSILQATTNTNATTFYKIIAERSAFTATTTTNSATNTEITTITEAATPTR